MSDDDDWPTEEDIEHLTTINVPVKIGIPPPGAYRGVRPFIVRAEWLDEHAGKRNWTWTPGDDPKSVIYWVPEKHAVMFKLSFAST